MSAVSFRDVDFRFAVAPWIRVSFFQTNYRAYVRGPDGRQAVHFFGTTLDSPLVAMPSRLWGMPWHSGRDVDRVVMGCGWHLYGLPARCSGRWGRADVELVGSAAPLERLEGFADADDAAHILTHPLDGWFEHPSGRLGRYAVWHPRMTLQMGSARRASYALFEELGLVEPGAAPHSVLLTRSIEFDVLLPPRRG